MSFEYPEISDEELRRHDVPAPRYTSYPTAPHFRDDFGPADFGAALERASKAGRDAPLSLYVHLPFCRELCTYCGCNVVIAREQAVADRYLDHLAKEVDLVADRLGPRTRLSQVHLGGGTPTFLTEAQLERLASLLFRRFERLPDAEVAIEANPSVTRVSQLETLARLGWNRLSLGIQDWDPEVQRAVNRVTPEGETRELVLAARRLGFESVSFDLIHGLPFQTKESWARTLETTISMAPDRIAVYSLAFVPEVRPHQKRLAVASMPTPRAKHELLRAAHKAFTGAGWVAIGIDHFARPEDSLATARARGELSRSFQGYTVRNTELVALGSTGISDVGGAYAQNVRPLPEYYERLAKGELPTERGIVLTDEDRRRRELIITLLCDFAVELTPEELATFTEELEALREHEREGLAKLQGTRIELTPLGRVFARKVAAALDVHLRRAKNRPTFSRTV